MNVTDNFPEGSKVSIEYDMLGVVAFLGNTRITGWLFSLFESLKEEDISDYLACIAMDAIKPSDRELIIAFVCGRTNSLTREEKDRFYHYGLIYGDICIPRAVRAYCKKYEKIVFGE